MNNCEKPKRPTLAERYKAFLEKWNLPPETEGELQAAIMDWLMKNADPDPCADLNPCIDIYARSTKYPRYLDAETAEYMQRKRR